VGTRTNCPFRGLVEYIQGWKAGIRGQKRVGGNRRGESGLREQPRHAPAGREASTGGKSRAGELQDDPEPKTEQLSARDEALTEVIPTKRRKAAGFPGKKGIQRPQLDAMRTGRSPVAGSV